MTSRGAACLLVASACAATSPAPRSAFEPAPRAPVARRVPHLRQLHGESFQDDYFWLREKGSPEVEAYLRAENAYALAQMKPTEPLQRRLYEEILSHTKETDDSVPYPDGGWLYWVHFERGQEHPVYLRRRPSGGPAEVVLDLNQVRGRGAFVDLATLQISDDGDWIAYSTDVSGFRQYTLQFKNLKTGRTSAESIPNVGAVVWFADSKTVAYVVEDGAKRPYRALRHVVGTDPAQDAVLYEEKDEHYNLDAERTRSKAFVLLTSESKVSSEVRFLDARAPRTPPRLVTPRRPDVQYFVDHNGDRFFIRTNDSGRNFRLVTAPVEEPSLVHWTQLRAPSDRTMLDALDMFEDHYVLRLLEGGLPQLEVVDLATGASHRIPFPEGDYDTGAGANAEFSAHTYRFTYESLTTPPSTFEWDLARRERHLLKEQEVPGFARAQYVAERIDARAADGTAIPISLVRRSSTRIDGTAPLLLTGYGSYGMETPVFFNEELLPLLDRGFVYAIAHVRGGGELGKAWHEQGRMLSKKNTFTDFIACAEHLIAHGYGAPDKVVIEGASAGGLLVGAVANLRPELFRAVLAEVPFVDVINTMSDASLPETVSEYEEWGDPNKPDEYQYLRSYSPYDNLERKAYPSMLVVSSYNDSQVMYWEPAKYVARLRALKTDAHPLLFKIDMEPAGHGGKSGRYEHVKDDAFEDAFILRELGLAEPLKTP